MRNRTPGLVALGLIMGAAGCGNDATTPGEDVSAADARVLAPLIDETSAGIIDATSFDMNTQLGVHHGGGPGQFDRTVNFSRTVSCPAGGEVLIEGEVSRTVDRETRTLTTSSSATRTHMGCAYDVRGATITIDGNPNLRVEANRTIVAGEHRGQQTMTHTGSFAWSRSTGESGICDVDIEAIADPATRTRTVTGTFCGHEIDRQVMWHARRGSGGGT